jgi:hypothetical protein
MRESTQKFIDILFNPDEEIYASPYGYTSKRNEDGTGWAFLWPSRPLRRIEEDDCVLVSINPVKGDVRNDDNVTAYRSFLVELDDGPLADQKKYIDDSGLPYSLCVFSGNKSLHFAVTLDHDLPSLELYKFHAEWILNTLKRADPNTKNPSRSIRIPGVQRTGKKMQQLVEVRGRVSHDRLMAYLSKYPECRPAPEVDENFEFKEENKGGMAKWVLLGLVDGFDMSKGRNGTWFSIGYEFGKCGYDLETTFETLEPLYNPEATFKEAEWRYCVNNGHSKAVKKYWRARE